MELSYMTVGGGAPVEYSERRSRFIGVTRPVACEEQARAFLDQRRREHRDARHHVYAYLIRDGGVRRYSDDGEPQGTGGLPVLEVLSGARVTDCIVVVSRIFGGVLLGTGGLARAYTAAAQMALEAAGVVHMRQCTLMCVVCDYSRYGSVSALIRETGGEMSDTVYTDRIELYFHLPSELVSRFEAALTELSSGMLTAERHEDLYRPWTNNIALI